MKCVFFILVTACSLGAAQRLAAAPSAPSIPQYAKFEASFTLPHQTGNPFDPADNDVQVTFREPGGRSVTSPAFWDGDCWRVRFAPPQVGAYTLTVRRGGAAITSANLSPRRFRCIPSDAPGFVRCAPKITQRFVFDSGQTYYPLGMNAAWTGGQSGGYPQIFQKMGAAHMNWARVWMTFWDGKALDWSPDRSKNPARGTLLLEAARRWDAIFEAADKNGVYVQMTLQHHGQYTEKADPNWQDNPFNAANGGFLARPDAFFTDPEARRLTKAKYRYIVARWGWSPHLLSYELFNEVQNIGEAQSHFADVVTWHKEMAVYLRSLDINHHLITTSVTLPREPLAEIGLDYDQPHEYAPDLISYFANLKGADKPLFVGEWGPNDFKAGLTGQTLHDGLWASLMAPTAGAGQFWSWDAVIAHHWWQQFASAADFERLGSATKRREKMERLTIRLRTTGAYGDLSFAPSGGWSKAACETVTVSPSGEAPDLSGVPSFIQGRNHRDMMPRPITFLLNCPAACRFETELGTIAKAGAHPTLTVDGVPAAEADFSAADADHEAGRTLFAALTAGPHQVTLFNTGSDWFVAARLTITHYAPPVAVLAKGSSHRLVFWVYNRNRSDKTPASATLLLDSLAPEHYAARLWDPWQGRALSAVPLVRRGRNWQLTLPAFSRDIAGVVESTKPATRPR